jgi:hypothetical protein
MDVIELKENIEKKGKKAKRQGLSESAEVCG